MRRKAALVAIAAMLALGGCSLFGSGGDEAEAEAEAVTEAAYEPVVEVREIEIGRTRNGLVITAIGTAAGLGYARPELRPRREGRPGPDGYLDFDFVARPPLQAPAATAASVTDVSERARTVRADHHIGLNDLRGVRGIRVHAAEGGMMMNF